ncbi:MAG: hypothetical protein WC967_15405 [Balneolaceae bacterium]
MIVNKMIFICFLYLIGGCHSFARPNFLIAQKENPENRSSKIILESEEIRANLEGIFDVNKRAKLTINLMNKTQSEIRLSYNKEEIWYNNCDGEKVHLDNIVFLEEHINKVPVTLQPDQSIDFLLTFKTPKCLPYSIPEERFVLLFNLNGLKVNKAGKNNINLFNEIIVYALK